MIKLKPEEIDDTYEEFLYENLSEYELKGKKGKPQFYTMKKGEDGFDRVKYYKKKLAN